MMVKALTPVRSLNLVVPLGHKPTAMRTTDTAAGAQAWSGAVSFIAVFNAISRNSVSLI